ncbi:MAG: hypothetical protein V3V08_23190 [Nannocystaceae bacterium]
MDDLSNWQLLFFIVSAPIWGPVAIVAGVVALVVLLVAVSVVIVCAFSPFIAVAEAIAAWRRRSRRLRNDYEGPS